MRDDDVYCPTSEEMIFLLSQIMDIESDMTQQIRALDSDMRTLIYENYAKFIAATDTIKQMKTDFKQMEEEMNQLSDNMASITNFRYG